MTRLPEPYADLLDHNPDPALRSVVADLALICAPAPLPPHLRSSITHALAVALEQPARRPSGWQRWSLLSAWPRQRRAVALLTLLAALLVAGVAYAAAPLLDQALSTSPGADQITQGNLGQEVSVTRRACGYTLTVSRIYADANLIVIGFTLGGPAGRRFLPAIGQVSQDLPSSDGVPTTVNLPTIAAQGKTLMPVQFGSSGVLTSDGAQYVAYDTRELSSPSGPLTLRLTVPAIQVFEQLADTPQASVACEPYSRMRDSHGVFVNGQQHDVNADHGRVVSVAGPFTYDLSVPVSPDVREYAPHTTIRQANGAAVALERVVVTRTDTRLFLSPVASSGCYPALTVAQPLSPNVVQGPMRSTRAGQTTYGAAPIRYFKDTGIGEYLVDAPLYDYHGAWTLVVQPPATGSDQGRAVCQDQPITFRFTLP